MAPDTPSVERDGTRAPPRLRRERVAGTEKGYGPLQIICFLGSDLQIFVKTDGRGDEESLRRKGKVFAMDSVCPSRKTLDA